MEEIQFSDFKENFNSIIKSICGSDKSVLIADQERPLVRITPVSSSIEDSWLGCMSGNGRIIGDIVSPAEESDVWEVLEK
uniref:Antitoxin n=2 Tax=unclassified Candidatus Kentrum TaxID=2643149 RepID=A0A451AQB0_9GAMM|nr:MAG: hypothetical protein BECKLFY1418A_GA0070994_11735 [Candidatus Kentron sp. LFY]VFK68220.1 MAG: hypothetical protein BECKUNK1418G_GA0071005_12166 [Candidatus Kentron sp. UNK]VFK73560.1 MAG: hypothetical protein BECKUNK1418H_GA0071006_12194 [Candidatus Kentron sp. UNK]